MDEQGVKNMTRLNSCFYQKYSSLSLIFLLPNSLSFWLLGEIPFLARVFKKCAPAVIIWRGCGRKVHALQPLGIISSTSLYTATHWFCAFADLQSYAKKRPHREAFSRLNGGRAIGSLIPSHRGAKILDFEKRCIGNCLLYRQWKFCVCKNLGGEIMIFSTVLLKNLSLE